MQGLELVDLGRAHIKLHSFASSHHRASPLLPFTMSDDRLQEHGGLRLFLRHGFAHAASHPPHASADACAPHTRAAHARFAKSRKTLAAACYGWQQYSAWRPRGLIPRPWRMS